MVQFIPSKTPAFDILHFFQPMPSVRAPHHVFPIYLEGTRSNIQKLKTSLQFECNPPSPQSQFPIQNLQFFSIISNSSSILGTGYRVVQKLWSVSPHRSRLHNFQFQRLIFTTEFKETIGLLAQVAIWYTRWCFVTISGAPGAIVWDRETLKAQNCAEIGVTQVKQETQLLQLSINTFAQNPTPVRQRNT